MKHLKEQGMNLDILTETERKLYNILQDGYPHRKQELVLCYDELGEVNGIYQHIKNLNDKIERHGITVKAVSKGRGSDYQMFRLIGRAARE